MKVNLDISRVNIFKFASVSALHYYRDQKPQTAVAERMSIQDIDKFIPVMSDSGVWPLSG